MISVIVPVYNVELYLSNCIESLQNQSYKELEIILVNDCSTDGSLAVCQEYAAKDSRIKIVDKKKNEGLGNARKSGVAVSTGQWICYVDSDDWVEPDVFQKVSKVLNSDVDIVVLGTNICYENAEKQVVRKDVISLERKKADTKQLRGDMLVYLDSNRSFPYMWNKLYQAEFVKNCGVEFNTIQSMEDFFYNIELFEKARCIISVEDIFYNYRRPVAETLATAYNAQFFELCKKRYLAELRFLRVMGADTGDNLQNLYLVYVKHLISCLIRDYSSKAGLTYKKRLKHAQVYLQDDVSREVLRKYCPQSQKWKVIKWIFSRKKYRLSVLLGGMAYLFQNRYKTIYGKVSSTYLLRQLWILF